MSNKSSNTRGSTHGPFQLQQEDDFVSVHAAEGKSTAKKFAMKKFDLGHFSLGTGVSCRAVKKEIETMRSLANGPNLVQLFDVFFEPNDGLYVIVEPTAVGRDLSQWMTEHGKLRESEAKRVTKQLMSAVSYMHNKGIAHREICAENILIKVRVPNNDNIHVC